MRAAPAPIPALALSVVAALALAAACSPAEPTAPERPKTVVLVVLDSVRADHVGVHGYGRELTPALDALATDAVVFESAYAASSSKAQSLAALWTGRLPSSSGATGLRGVEPHSSLATLPRLFLRAGWRTALASNDTTLRARGFTRGFEDVEVDSTQDRWAGERVTAKALEMVDAAGDEPLFLAVDFADASEPHFPLEELRLAIEAPVVPVPLSLPNLRGMAADPPAGIRATPEFADLVARYDAEIAYVDRCLGALLDGLAERGRLDDAVVIVTSSHGVEWMEHGYVGTGWTLYDEVLRVPLVVRAPTLLAPARVEMPVSLADLAPTLGAIFGLEPVAHAGGEPLVELGDGAMRLARGRGPVLAELVVPELTVVRAAIAGGWKRIETVVPAAPGVRVTLDYDAIVGRIAEGERPRPDPWGAPRALELYRLGEPEQPERDRARTSPDVLERLAGPLSRLAELCREHGLEARGAERAMELPEDDELEALRQVGYL